MGQRSLVSIVKTAGHGPEEIEAATRQAILRVGGLEGLFGTKDLVLIKPNLVATPPHRLNGAVTRWEVCKAIADLVREAGGKAVIADSAAVGSDTEKVMEATGYLKLREKGYEVVDLKSRPRVMRTIPHGKVLQEVTTFDLVEEAKAIISVPVMKTHDQTEITLALKNLKGLVDDREKRRLHQEGVQQGVLDLYQAFRPALAVVDATFAQEGLGPVHGRTLEMNLIIAGKDLVAVDAMAGRVMGFDPEEVLITRWGAERGLGVMDLDGIDLVGEPWQGVRRRFMRLEEDKRVQVEGLRILHAQGSCTGCRNTVLSALFDMKKANQLQYLQGLTIITGPEVEVPPDVSSEQLIAVGVCVSKDRRGKRFVSGCPPNNAWVVEEIVRGRKKEA
ncbi:MAG: DUF362 domain-containing protein [candidate division NC10 bacterium]|nr:DUF362 domain-containing protein [candidate division NC10 bacterium]